MRETLVAQQLDGYDAEVGAALWRLEECRERTARVLADVAGADLDREVGGNTIGTIVYHLALIELDWLFSEILEEPVPSELAARFPVDDRDAEGVLLQVRGETLDEHRARLDAVRRTLLERLRPMTAEDLHRVRVLPGYDVTPSWVLHHLAQHEAEHRGEIGSVLARLAEPQTR